MSAKTLLTWSAFRFSLRQMLLWTALVALACVALPNASPTWVATLLGLILLVLTAAVPLAIFRQGPQWAFWLGFALFGWMYVLVLAYGWSLDSTRSKANPLAPQWLATAFLSSYAYEQIYATQDALPIAYSGALPDRSGARSVQVQFESATPLGSGDSVDFIAIDPASDFTSHLSLVVTGGQKVRHESAQRDFINVAHAFWTLLLATLGGWFTRWVSATRASRDSASKPATSG